jgi:phage terminase large subunit
MIFTKAKTCKEAIIQHCNKWMTYNQICNALKGYPYNYGTVERNVRWLVEDGRLLAQTEKVKFDRVKYFRKFKRLDTEIFI